MKKLIAWPMFLITFWTGHLASKVCNCGLWPQDMDEPDAAQKVFNVFFNIYQGGMRRSVFWSDWGDLRQWSTPS